MTICWHIIEDALGGYHYYLSYYHFHHHHLQIFIKPPEKAPLPDGSKLKLSQKQRT